MFIYFAIPTNSRIYKIYLIVYIKKTILRFSTKIIPSPLYKTKMEPLNYPSLNEPVFKCGDLILFVQFAFLLVRYFFAFAEEETQIWRIGGSRRFDVDVWRNGIVRGRVGRWQRVGFSRRSSPWFWRRRDERARRTTSGRRWMPSRRWLMRNWTQRSGESFVDGRLDHRMFVLHPDHTR